MFKLVKIEQTFLSKPTNTWISDHSSNKLKTLTNSFKVTNDTAIRTVILGSDFTEAITKNEEQRQVILQEVEQTRRMYSKATKLFFSEDKNLF